MKELVFTANSRVLSGCPIFTPWRKVKIFEVELWRISCWQSSAQSRNFPLFDRGPIAWISFRWIFVPINWISSPGCKKISTRFAFGWLNILIVVKVLNLMLPCASSSIPSIQPIEPILDPFAFFAAECGIRPFLGEIIVLSHYYIDFDSSRRFNIITESKRCACLLRVGA